MKSYYAVRCEEGQGAFAVRPVAVGRYGSLANRNAALGKYRIGFGGAQVLVRLATEPEARKVLARLLDCAERGLDLGQCGPLDLSDLVRVDQ